MFYFSDLLISLQICGHKNEHLFLTVHKPSYQNLEELVTKLLIRVDKLEAESVKDKLRIKALEDELATYKNPKNSNNSSIPPSQDQNRPRKTQSLREKSGKKSGGQPGHKGSTLNMVAAPDKIFNHIPDTCSHCGKNLSKVAAVFSEKRQVIEIPPLNPIFIQHEVFSRTCTCGKVNCGAFPDGLAAPVQYGESVQNLIAYLSARHYLPFKRITELMHQLFNVPLSEGTIANLLQKTANNLYPSYLQIKSNIENSPVVGGDETGIIVNGELQWIWTWQDTLNTFLALSDNRGKDTVNTFFPQGLPGSILVSDAWAAHLSTDSKGHQLCLAHMLRELNYFIELYPFNQWPENLRTLFVQAIDLKKRMTPQHYNKSPERDKILRSFERLLKQAPPQKCKFHSFYKRLLKYKEAIFNFLFYPDVPADNNGSERSIRNVKVKQKVSGQFKTPEGAQAFTIIRSVIDTLIKRNLDVLVSLAKIPNLAPE